MNKKHPIQPVEKDDDGFLRFKQNAIVRYLLDNGPFDLNHLAVQRFSDEDREQFAQLIGYSLSGFSELDYVSDEAYEAATLMAEQGKTEQEAKIEYLQTTLETVREGLKQIVPSVFKIHPDDLEC